MAKKGSGRPLKAHEGGALQPDEKKRARFPTPDEMDVLDSILSAGGSFPTPEVAAWRKIRQLANRMKYEANRGEPHPAWESAYVGDPKETPADHVAEVDPMTWEEFGAMIEPPEGTSWAGFGATWDIGPDVLADGNYEAILRHRSISSQWSGIVGSQAEKIKVD
jgi:hypothetical protein